MVLSSASSRGRFALLLALIAVTVVVVAIVSACLPDLPALPAPDARSDADDTPPPTPFSGCGDSIIETLDDGGVTGETCDPGDASVAGCESCKFVCSGKINDAGHCYFFADNTKDYPSAVTACANAAAHVVTFASEREVAFVNDLVATFRDGGAYWVGLSIQPELGDNYGPPNNLLEPGFPRASTCAGCFAVGDGGPFPPHPDYDAGGSCLVAERGAWLQVPTDPKRDFLTVCEREPIGQRLFYCGGPNCTTLAATAGTKRYVLPQALVTEADAVKACAPYGKLVHLDSNEEREQLVRQLAIQFALKPGKPIEVWVGLSTPDGGAWLWDDAQGLTSGEKERPPPWGEGEPAAAAPGTRAYLQISERQFDTQLARSRSDAGVARAVVCERPPP